MKEKVDFFSGRFSWSRELSPLKLESRKKKMGIEYGEFLFGSHEEVAILSILLLTPHASILSNATPHTHLKQYLQDIINKSVFPTKKGKHISAII